MKVTSTVSNFADGPMPKNDIVVLLVLPVDEWRVDDENGVVL